MRRLLDIAIDEISRKLRHGTALAVEALSLVDGGGLEKISAVASELHKLHLEVSDLVIEAVARYSPVATDLRFLKGALFISYDLYRVARYALDIEIVLEKLDRSCDLGKIRSVLDVVKKMLEMSIEMFLNRDISNIKEVERLDDEVVDKAYEESLLRLLERTDRCLVTEAVVLRLLERASDHAVYISKHAYYLVTGKTKS
ncbi:MAG: phosphate uptake regulator PhoU [Pyrobaculum sp.]